MKAVSPDTLLDFKGLPSFDRRAKLAVKLGAAVPVQSVAGLQEMPTFLMATRQDLAWGQLSHGEAFIAWAINMLLTLSSLLQKSAVGLGLQAPLGDPGTLRP